MNYGIYLRQNNEADVTHFKSKKIKNEGLVHVSHLQNLLKVLKSGDVVHVISVDRFPSVSLFYGFVKAVVRQGASIRILEQPYLDAGNGKVYKNSVMKHLDYLCRLENYYIPKMKKMMRLNPAGEQYLDQCIREIMIFVLSETYSSEGILRRSS